MYKILGSDGNEYDSISAEKVKQWIQEGRLEKTTPVMPDGAEDWIFLGDLPEFAGGFASVQPQVGAVPAPKKRRWMAIGIGLFLLAAVAMAVLFILQKAKHH